MTGGWPEAAGVFAGAGEDRFPWSKRVVEEGFWQLRRTRSS